MAIQLTKQEYDAIRYREKYPLKTHICLVCGVEYLSNRRKKYCSLSCEATAGSRRHHQKHNGTLEYCLKKLCGAQGRKSLHWADVFALYQKQEGKCALSGVTMTFDKSSKITALSIDRIDAGKEYTKENIRLVCNIVNSMRSNMTDEELFNWCSIILTKNGRS